MNINKSAKEDTVITEKSKIEDLRSSYFGEFEDGKLVLDPVEVAYLNEKEKISLEDTRRFFLDACDRIHNFELKFGVYRDIRDRGLHLKKGGKAADFLLYKRGNKPDQDPFNCMVDVYSERNSVDINHVLKRASKSENLRKKYLIALVDGEGDITYYLLREVNPSGTCEEPEDMEANGFILEERVLVEENGRELYEDFFYGKPFSHELYQVTPIEAHHLTIKEILSIDGDLGDLTSILDSPSTFHTKYKVYKDLRERGLIPKTGFKFGTHFRAYTEFEGIDNLSHAKFLVHALDTGKSVSSQQLSRTVRLTQNVRKRILFAIVPDDTGKIRYLEFKRVKL